MAENNTDTALLKTQEFASRFPAVATVLAKQTSTQAPTPTALMSDPGQEKISRLFSGDDQAYDDLLNFELPDTAGQSTEDATTSLFGAAEQNIRAGSEAKRNVLTNLDEAQENLDRLSSFNKAAYTKKRLKELDPVSDLDAEIAEIRQQMFVEDIRLDADPELEGMSPAQRSAIRARAQEKHINAITELSAQRRERLAAAEGQIDDEISANDDQINASIARVNALTRTMDSIKELGKDNEALVSIRMDLMKEQERLKKLRKGAGGKAGTAYSTQKEMAKIRLREQYLAEGRPINEDEIDATVEAYFLRAAGETSIVGVKGDEVQSVNIDAIEPPPEFRELPDALDTGDKVLAIDRIDGLSNKTLKAVGGGDADEGRKILLESLQ